MLLFALLSYNMVVNIRDSGILFKLCYDLRYLLTIVNSNANSIFKTNNPPKQAGLNQRAYNRLVVCKSTRH